MGSQSIVHGYIESDIESCGVNSEAINGYKYDEIYPFTNIFSVPVEGYEVSIISFAGSYKSLHEEWGEWQRKFEKFLSCLQCNAAYVSLYDELDGELWSYSYVRQRQARHENEWVRYKSGPKDEELEETNIEITEQSAEQSGSE